MEGSSRIDRKSSIEMEPRALSIDQIHFAREAALYVLNTRSIEEASSIFTQGLKPVVSSVRDEEIRSTMMDWDEEEFDCSRNESRAAALPSPKDVASAPF